MRVLFLVGREIGYARNQVLHHAFKRFADVDVVASPNKPNSLLTNSARIAAVAASKLIRNHYDLVFVGFYGHIILRLVRPLVRSPLLFDAFVSTYDTLCFDRKLFSPRSPMGRLAYRLDWSAIRSADHILLDTQQHIDYFVETFNQPRSKFDALPVGCDDSIYRPAPLPSPHEPVTVLSYSTFLALHGVDTILHAASLLRDKPVHFLLIGDGPAYKEMRNLASQLALTNVAFKPPVSQPQLAEAIAGADICLGGHFDSGGKASRVIPGKVYQMMAVGRPLIAGDTPANRVLLTHKETAWLVPTEDPQALASAILTLAGDADLRGHLARKGRRQYETCCSEVMIRRSLERIVNKMIVQ